MVQRIKGPVRYYEGLSIDEKPKEFIIGSRFYEIDTSNTYDFDGTNWVLLPIQKTRVFLWNTESWEWEASTKGSGTGEAVSVENFPTVISGAFIPVKDADTISILNSILTKITGLVFVVELGSFVATIE